MREQPEKGNASEGRISEASSVKNQAINQGINMNDSTQASANRAITVPFHGAELYVVEHNGQPYTPMKPIVQGMELDWKSQHRKLASNRARWGVVEITIPESNLRHHDGDTDLNGHDDHAGQRRRVTCLPIRKVAGWLSTIDAGRVKNPEARAKVIQYQNECDDVLWKYWSEGIVINPRAAYVVNPGDKLTKEEAETLRLMLKNAVDRQPKEKQGVLMMQGWSKLKAHFNVSYREIPRHEFSEAVSIIARHTAAWEVVDETPARQSSFDDAVRLDHAFAIATQTAAKVQRVVFKGIMSGNADWRHGRYLLGMLAGGPDEDVGVELQSVAPDACVVPISRFHKVLEDTILVDAQTLTRLASVCTARLGRMAQRTTA
ncbi:phage antirepressor N-terminal domain-containing protein [Comamonas testosteroni]|uniref:phage antirepressor N-terminal domain-containing protein n=1 Tax=Comamonas testosteroni TaxID=285 RepID=UPI0006B993EB|nr:phage antirepressor N-terminal domain-containing protein [Comamonas testosteroni]